MEIGDLHRKNERLVERREREVGPKIDVSQLLVFSRKAVL